MADENTRIRLIKARKRIAELMGVEADAKLSAIFEAVEVTISTLCVAFFEGGQVSGAQRVIDKLKKESADDKR